MYLDPVSETIAHFIGHFNLIIEQARMREAYDRIKALAEADEEKSSLVQIDAAGAQSHVLVDFNPGVQYSDPGEPIQTGVAPTEQGFHPPHIPDLPVEAPALPVFPQNFAAAIGGHAQPQLIVEPPSNLAVLIKQKLWLSDSDYFNNADLDIEPQDAQDAWDQLAALAGKAAALGWFEASADLSSEDGIAQFVSDAQSDLEALDLQETGATGAEGTTVTVFHDASLSGNWVNGSADGEIPDFQSSLPPALQPQQDGAPGGPVNAVETGGFHDLTAGSNTLVNQANLASNWIGAPVVLVQGNSISLDIISQTNVIQDIDTIGAGVPFSWEPAQGNGQFSIASFNIAPNPVAGPAGGDDGPAGAPANWAVTTIDGNLIFLNWIEQYSLMSDGDTTVLSASGAATMTVSGGNLSINNVSLLELGHYYDLIVIGGDMYHANIIQQMNMLLDDDTVWVAGDHPPEADGTLGVSGNLLWNQATINTFGETSFEGLEGDYLETLENFLAGDETIEDGVLSDPAFAWLNAISVLYVTGDLIELQYLQQTNILGDSDQVALVAQELLSDPQAHWTIETGGNALANFASITDAGVDAAIHVGGEQYSDALLYQAELISNEPPEGGNDPLALASEAVAFLSDDLTVPDNDDGGEQSYVHADGTPADVMQTMLG